MHRFQKYAQYICCPFFVRNLTKQLLTVYFYILKSVYRYKRFSKTLYSLAVMLGAANQLISGFYIAGCAQHQQHQLAPYGKHLGRICYCESPKPGCSGALCLNSSQLSGNLVCLCPRFLLCCPKIYTVEVVPKLCRLTPPPPKKITFPISLLAISWMTSIFVLFVCFQFIDRLLDQYHHSNERVFAGRKLLLWTGEKLFAP